ncbi:hypothetical protein GCM10027592_63310 [Spirosoma flavus]
MAKQLPKSVRFDSDVEEQLEALSVVFDEPPARIINRAVKYLFENKESAIESEMEARRKRLQDLSNKKDI